MGLSSSKRVTGNLHKSSEFISACDTVYEQSLALSQQAFPGIPRYQIASASDRLYQTLSDRNIPLINKWVKSAPTRSQIDKSLQKVVGDDDVTIGDTAFKELAVDLYAEAIVWNAQKAVLSKIPLGVAGIVGIGVATRSGMDVVGTGIGVCAVGVATCVYLSLGG